MKFIKMKSVAGNAKIIFCLAVILLLSLWGAPQAFAATWTLESTTSPNAYFISYANGKFYLTGSGGLLTSSNDCITWSPLTSGTGDDTNYVAFGNSTYVVGSANNSTGNSGSLISSANGTIWGKYDTSNPIYCVAFGDGTFVAGSYMQSVFYSTNGSSWTEVPLEWTTSRSINGVTYANGKFVAVGGNSGEGFSYTSADGVHWSASTFVTTSTLWAVTGGTDGAGNPVFVAVSDNGGIFSSPDGATWTERVSGLPIMYGVTYGNGEFVAVGSSGTVKTSTDGVNWTTDTVPGAPDLFSVTYGGNVFAALGSSGGVYTRSSIYPPAVMGINPSNGPTAGGTVVTITGTNLAGATSVKFGSSSGTITANTPTSITVTSPAGSAGTVDITVTTAGGTSETSASDRFTYFAPPTVTGITPADGLSAGGTSVTITGTNFTGATAVTIGGASATGIAVVNSTTITATTPAGTAGVQDVIVTTPGGSGTGTGIYTYTVAPTVTTQAVSAITSTAATGNGNITSLGVPNPTQYGVVWSTSSEPTTALSTKTTQGAVSTTGAFTSSITGLTPNTTYYVRAYATNTAGTSYGAEVSFKSLPAATTPSGNVTTNINGSIKKDAEISLSSEAGATIYYTVAVNMLPSDPTVLSSSISNGDAITNPALTLGDVLNIKAYAVVASKSESTIATLSYTVQSKTELTLTGITLSNKEYDGNTDATADFTGAGLSGKIGADLVSLTGTPNASFLTADAADGKTVTVSGYSLTGADAEYYTLDTTLTLTANINKKALTLGTIIIAVKQYDGTGTATITSIPISGGVVGSDDVSTDISLASASFDTGSGIGTGKAVTVSGIVLTGADSGNYSVSSTAAATGEITAKTVSVNSVTIAGKAYDGNTTASITGATLNGKVGAEDVTIDYSSATAAFADALVGNGKTVTVTGLVLGGGDKANYVLDSGSFTTTGNITGLGTIAEPTASVADYTVIKSGATVTLTTTGYDGTTLYYTVGSAPQDPTSGDASIATGGTITITGNPGDAIILKVYGTKAGYEDSSLATLHYTIQPKSTLTVTGAVANSKDYDGTRTAAVSGGVLSGSIVTGDDVSLDTSAAVGLFSDKNAGDVKTVTVSGYALTGGDAIYYDLTQPTLTADIRVKNITVSSIVISDKVYDGTTTADISSITLNWKASGDEVYVNIPAATAVFDDASIDSDKAVNITGLELAGADAGNYQLTSTTASATGNIVPAGAVATPEASPSAGSVLSGTSITLTTATSGATIYYTMNGDEPTGGSEYTDPLILTGDPGTVITVKAMAEKTGMTNSGTLTQQYTIAEPGALIIFCTPGNQVVTLSWNEIPGTTAYKVYSEGSYLGNGVSVTDSVYGYDATGLSNGTQYNFTVNALDSEQRITNSAHASATPRTVPGVPTNVRAVAGNGQATVSFDAPSDNGGSEITGYIVTSNPGGITVSGAGSPITVTGLTNGTEYTFKVKAINGAGNGLDSSASGPITPRAPERENSNPDNNTAQPPAPPATNPAAPTTQATEILVNGQAQNAGTTTVATIDNQTVTTITVDDKKIEEKLNTEGNNATVVIAVNNASDIVVGVLNGQTVKNMEVKEAILEIKTGSITYTIPASEINIDAVSAQIGEQIALKDIEINISVAAPSVETVRIVEDSANSNNYQIVVKPVEFEITCTNGNKTVEVSKFNAFVERTIAIPDGIDPSKITTGIVLNNDGTFSHVPTTITIIDGKYYAKINSLTNSTYSVIYNPKAFKDVESHWAKEAVNDMGSRLVVNGDEQGRFEPDKNITRAEFAAIVMRALGLMRPGTGTDSFKDVAKDAWYYDAVSIANQYDIVSGYGDGKFRPMESITREQAMTMVARAMKITGLKADLAKDEMDRILEAFSDASMSADYTKYGIAACIENGIVSGRNGKLIAPKDNISRAETAVIIRRLLRASGLI